MPAGQLSQTPHTRTVSSRPRHVQSVAALLPAEIYSAIFYHFRYNYSIDAPLRDSTERDAGLSNISLVAQEWAGPARRLLFRNVSLKTPEQVFNEISDWAGEYVRTLRVTHFGRVTPEFSRKEMETKIYSQAIFRLLSKVRHLEALRLDHMPFTSFDIHTSNYMRNFILLPSLSTLRISARPSCGIDYLPDIIATANRNVRDLECWDEAEEDETQLEEIDFGGNLRRLVMYGERLISGEGSFRGIRELRMSSGSISSWRVKELFRCVGPTLGKLTHTGDPESIAPHLLLLHNLTHLTFSSNDSAPTLCLANLPPSIIHLNLCSDRGLLSTLERWDESPLSAPPNLRLLTIDFIESIWTLIVLPPLDYFVTSLSLPRSSPIRHYLREATPGTIPFKKLKVYRNRILWRGLQTMCERLGVGYSEVSLSEYERE